MPGPDALDRFHPVARAWFARRYGAPSPPQVLGWPHIAEGRHVLITAPTGSGKTLAAFFKCLDALWQDAAAGRELSGVQVLYVSPLKALNADIERNLREPLAGVQGYAAAAGVTLPRLEVAVRTGDTPAQERARMVRRPPHVLITTPESLYLILTSARAREMLRTVRYAIVDEIHAMLDSKRGTHLAVSLERLEELCHMPPVRIGLTATVRPLERAARFLGGQDADGRPRPVAVADAGLRKEMDLLVEVPVEEMGSLPDGSIWPALYDRLLELVRSHRSTLIFVNFRRSAERTAARLNELAGAEIAQTHHGSLSKEQRRAVEERLKAGDLPCLVATASLELGIDVGAIDLVVQVESPKGIARGLQRVGRAGHLLGAASKGRILPKYRTDLLEAAAAARAMRSGRVEAARVPQNCLDVLAQQVAAMAAADDWAVDRLLAVLRRAYPYRGLSRRQLEGVLGMLAGRYATETFAELRPRLTWDAINGEVRARPGLRILATRSGGTIPDRGLYSVMLQGAGRVKLGEVDEEFAFERRVGDTFVLGTSTWRIQAITHDTLEVTPAPGAPAMVPFWRAEAPGRPLELGRAVGQLSRELAGRLEDPGVLDWLQAECALDGRAAANLRAFLWETQEHLGEVPSDHTLVLEWWRDEVGAVRLMLHSPYGLPVHAALGLALRRKLLQALGSEPEVTWGDDGVLFRLPPLEGGPPVELIRSLGPGEAEDLLLHELGASALLGAHFRMAAELALLLPRHGRGERRTPLWLQRLKAKDLLDAVRRHADFPILLEAYRDVLQNRLDLDGMKELLGDLQSGAIRLHTVEVHTPSASASGLMFYFTAFYLYEGDQPRAERAAAALSLERSLLLELLGAGAGLRKLLEPAAIAEVDGRLQHTSEGRRARSADELHDLLLRLGDLCAAETAARCDGDAGAMLAGLAAAGRALEAQAGSGRRWIAAEDRSLYAAAGGDGAPAETAADIILRRFARTRGPFTLEQAAGRYGWDPDWVRRRLAVLEAEGRVAAGGFTPGGSSLEWCDLEVLERIRRRSLAILRRQVDPVEPAEYARFLWEWQGCGGAGSGPVALRRALRQLQGLYLPAAQWEREVLPRRVTGYQPSWLDQLLAGGELLWAADGDRIAFFSAEDMPALAAPPGDPAGRAAALSADAGHVLEALRRRGAAFLGPLALTASGVAGAALTPARTLAALWELVGAGLATNDTFAPLRELLRRSGGRLPGARAAGKSAGATPRELLMSRGRRAAEAAVTAAVAGGTGRWSLLPWAWDDPLPASEGRAAAWVNLLLDRYGVLGREMAVAEAGAPPWGQLLPLLRQMELQGRVRQGYFIAGLSGMQFARPDAVERLRAARRGDAPEWDLRPGLEPANPYGPVLPLPAPAEGRWRYTRVAGTYLVLRGGEPALAVEGFGRRLVPLMPLGEDDLLAAAGMLHRLLRPVGRERPVRRVEVEWWADRPAAEAPVAQALLAAGFEPGYRRLVLYPGRSGGA